MKKILCIGIMLAVFAASNAFAGYAERLAMSENPEYRGRVKLAIVDIATAVKSEAATAPNHAFRDAYAQRIFDGNIGLNVWYLAIVNYGEVATNIDAGTPGHATDQQLKDTISALFNHFAGVSTGE
jgi:hypothetical protein